jgi:rRNA maturation endonuclease Nob1
MSMGSRQKEVATRKRDKKAKSKQKNHANLSKTPSGQKALTLQLTAKANEDLLIAEDDELLRNFARSDNQAALAAMYEGCENQK